MNKSVCIAAVATAAALSMMSGAAQAKRISTSYLATFVSGESFEIPIRSSCLKTGNDPDALEKAVMACYISALNSQQPRGDVVSDARIAVETQPKPGGRYLISWNYYHNGKPYMGGKSGVTINGYCDKGGLFDATFRICTKLESVADCINRQDTPNRTVLYAAQKDCAAKEETQKADIKSKFDRWRLYGSAAAGAVAAYMSTVPGAGWLAAVWTASSGYEWVTWCNKAEEYAKSQAHVKEQACEAPYVATYRSKNTAIVKDCNS